MRYVLLLQSESTVRALGVWLELLEEAPLKDFRDPRVIMWVEHSYWTINQSYEHWVNVLEDAVRAQLQTANPVTVLVDHVDPDRLSVIAPGSGWNTLLAMLLLTFPEFRWVFGTCSNSQIDEKKWDQIKIQHALPTLLSGAVSDPLFDPSGLRQWIRRRTNEQLKNLLEDDLQLPERQKTAAVIDEEQSYVFFNGYCAYRFGFRVDLVDTWAKMENRFGQSAKSPHPYWLLLENMSLNFPDRATDIKLHDLDKERAKHCPLLDSTDTTKEQSQHRILITTGQTRPNDDTLKDNRDYLEGKKLGTGTVVLKPASGLFDLWEQAQLPGFAPSFRWPPWPPGPYNDNKNLRGHGAPGKLLLVAEMLIKRANRINPVVKSMVTTVLGATLATDALELTGGRTPTTAIEALSLKHQFEVLTECQFSGVEYHISVKPRIDEIRNILNKNICRWFSEDKRKRAELNACMHILNQLVRILGQYNQFDEEQLCRNKTRELHHKLWMLQKPFRRCIPWLGLKYLDFTLNSLGNFTLAILGWIAGLWLIFGLLSCSSAPSTLPPSFTFHPFWEAFHRFFNHTMAPNDLGWRWQIVTASSVIAGIVHVGIFIAHMYTYVTRK